jgi:hypothetical protein
MNNQRRVGLSLLVGTSLVGGLALASFTLPLDRLPLIVTIVANIILLPGAFVLYIVAVGYLADLLFYVVVTWMLLGLVGRNRRRKA